MYHIHDRNHNHPSVRVCMLIVSILTVLLPMLCTHQTFAESGSPTIFTPAVIPFSADEIGNPGRGLHRWNGQSFVPAPMRDSYRRRHWSEIETDTGVYNFKPYDTDVQYAQHNGMRLILGLPQPTGPSFNGGSWVPDDLTSDHLGAWNRGSYHPNFNDPTVMTRWKALIDAIAQRYATDERVSGIQLCIVGAYGEWYFDSTVPQWARPSDATAQAMIDYIIAKFPNKQLYMLLSTTMPQATVYALQRSPRIGWARMALGDDQFDHTFSSHYASNANWLAIVANRWKTGPVMVETLRSGDPNQLATILDQVKNYHVSLVGNGNFEGAMTPVTNWSSKQVSDFQLAGKISGYRYVLSSLTLSPLATGQSFTATSAWANVGIAPIYQPWQIHMQLRNASNAVVFDTTSAFDLRDLLPADGKPTTQADTWTLPADLTPGTYHVHVFIPPLNTYVPALQLAIEGKQSDGSYDLGNVVVTSGAAAPAGVPTTTPTRGATTVPTSGPIRSPTAGPTTSPTATAQPNNPQTITFLSDADTRVNAAEPDTNYGKWNTLRIDNGPDPEIQSYLRFAVSNLPSTVVSATLRIYATSQSVAGAAVYGTAPTWTEKGLTWNNRPHPNTSVAGKAVAVHANTWVTYDITPLIKGNGTVSLVLIARSTDGMNFTSRETNTKPHLLVTVAKP